MISRQNRSLAQALRLERSDSEAGYVAEVSAEWTNGRTAYGGLVAGQLVRAAQQAVEPQRVLRSLLLDFAAPVEVGSVRLETRVLRHGRALTHVAARMLQAGQVCAVMAGSFGLSRVSNLRVSGTPAPALGRPEGLARLPYVEGVFPRCTQHFDYRWGSERLPFTGSERANVGGYVRHAQPGPVDAAGVLALIDAWPPAILPLLAQPAPASTVTWMVDFVGPVAPVASESQAFYRYEGNTVAAADGYASCEAQLWGPGGELVAASRQLVVEFS